MLKRGCRCLECDELMLCEKCPWKGEKPGQVCNISGGDASSKCIGELTMWGRFCSKKCADSYFKSEGF